jgi:hypothetical protein
MRTLIKACLLLAAAAVPVYAQSDTKEDATPMPAPNCPMMADTAEMENGMSGIVSEMGAAMDATKDPAMKQRLQGMRDRMNTMMANMRTMQEHMAGGMMTNMKMRGEVKGAPAKNSAKVPEPPLDSTPRDDNHEQHHSSR